MKRYLKNLRIKESSFLTESENLYDLKFGFKQNLSTSRVLIILTENVRQTLDDEYIGCGIFVDLQKAFDTVVHEILLSKLDCCSTWGISNNCFKFYLCNRKEFVSIKSYDSGLAKANFGSVLGPLPFLLYINDPNQPI